MCSTCNPWIWAKDNTFGYLRSPNWAQILFHVSGSAGFIEISMVRSLRWVDFFCFFICLTLIDICFTYKYSSYTFWLTMWPPSLIVILAILSFIKTTGLGWLGVSQLRWTLVFNVYRSLTLASVTTRDHLCSTCNPWILAKDNTFGYLRSPNWAQILFRVSGSSGFIEISMVRSLRWVDFFCFFICLTLICLPTSTHRTHFD